MCKINLIKKCSRVVKSRGVNKSDNMEDIMKDIDKNRNLPNKTPICLGIGLSIGGICGALLKNIPIGLLIVGCVGSYYAVIAKRNIHKPEDPEQSDTD